MPGLFDYAWAANRLLSASPRAFALAKRLYDRLQGAPDRELARLFREPSQAPSGPAERGRVLFFSPRYWPVHVSWQIVVARALRAEGYEPEFIGCGGAASLCDMYTVEMRRGGFCRYCDRSLGKLVAAAGLPYRELDDFIDGDAVRREARERTAQLDLDDCRDFRDGGVPIGRLLEPTVARSLRQVMFEPDEATLRTYRGFIETALINLRAIEGILQEPWALTFMLNGKFLAESMLYHLAEERGIDRVTYEGGFRRNTMLFAVNGFVTDLDVSQHFERVRDVPLEEAEEQRLRSYEATRRVGEGALVQYFPDLEEDVRAITAEYGIDTNRPIAAAFPNIVWDTAVYGRERAFSSIWEWVRSTIEAYREMPDWQLVMRIHPAEVRLPVRTRESMLTLIQQHFGELPPNVHLIPPSSSASSYVLLDLASRVLVYSSTVGLEAAMQGKQVVTTARTHYAEKGFTCDAHDAEGYRKLLGEPPAPVSKEVRSLARRYANLFFFRFHVPVRSVEEPRLAKPVYRFASGDELLSGDFPEVEFVRRDLLRLEPGCQVSSLDPEASGDGTQDP